MTETIGLGSIDPSVYAHGPRKPDVTPPVYVDHHQKGAEPPPEIKEAVIQQCRDLGRELPVWARD